MRLSRRRKRPQVVSTKQMVPVAKRRGQTAGAAAQAQRPAFTSAIAFAVSSSMVRRI
jgi:hypothetical protein